MVSQLKLTSYNSTGFGPGKPEYVSKLVECSDFVLLQEHWLRESQFHRIKSLQCKNATVLSHNVSAINDNIFTQGRGFGGCSILWKSTLNAKVTPVTLSSNRICAVQVSTDLLKFIIFNVYMPCDVAANIGVYTSAWEEISVTCDQLQCNNIIVGGDFNTSLDRNDSRFTQCLINAAEIEDFKMCIDYDNSDIKYTFTSPVNHSTHIIDHFIVSMYYFNVFLSFVVFIKVIMSPFTLHCVSHWVLVCHTCLMYIGSLSLNQDGMMPVKNIYLIMVKHWTLLLIH